MATYGDSVKVVLSENTRWGYANVWEPKSLNGERPKYSVSLIIKKGSPDMETIGNAIKEVYRNSSYVLTEADGTVPPLNTLKLPVRDGDVERKNDPIYAGCYFINAYSVYAPGIVDIDLNEITDRSQVYSGCYGRASISFYAFNTGENSGIACTLHNLQKVKDGERLGGGNNASDDFKSFSPAKSDFETTTTEEDQLPF